jgi:hypothetical protein
MGTQGVPLSYDRSYICEIIKKRKGVITHICEDLDVSHAAILRYIKNDPDLDQLLKEARHHYSDTLCDLAEGTLLFTVGQREDLTAALRSAQFILNNQGRNRGYTPPTMQAAGEEQRVDLKNMSEAMKLVRSELQAERQACQNDSKALKEPLQAEIDKSQ